MSCLHIRNVHPVWPDDGVKKVAQFYPKVATVKRGDQFQMAQKVTYCLAILTENLSPNAIQ